MYRVGNRARDKVTVPAFRIWRDMARRAQKPTLQPFLKMRFIRLLANRGKRMTFQDRRGGGAVTLKPDGTIKLLLKYNIPITRESYLSLVFAGNPPKELDPEIAEELIDLGISRILPDAKWTQ